MNDELRSCLHELGVEGADDPEQWKRVVVVVNYGRVPRADGSALGFKLLLLNAQGRTEWFGRCSWASRAAMEREVEIIDALTADPFGARHTPEGRTSRGRDLFVQISRYLGECSYGSVVAERPAVEWMRDVREIVELSERLMRVVRQRVSWLADAPSLEVRREWVEADLRTLAAAGLERSLLDQLRAGVEPSLRLPIELQHGDLWPQNVLRHRDRWWLIDYAECGMVWSPLYDLMHMVANAPAAASKSWFALPGERPLDEWSEARRTLLREAAVRRGMTSLEMASSLLYYLVHLTAYRLRPGVRFELSADLRMELARVGTFLSSTHGSLAGLLPLDLPDQRP